MEALTQRCGRCNITFAIAEGGTSYARRYSCGECGIPFWELKGCGAIVLGIEPVNAPRLPVGHTGKVRERAEA